MEERRKKGEKKVVRVGVIAAGGGGANFRSSRSVGGVRAWLRYRRRGDGCRARLRVQQRHAPGVPSGLSRRPLSSRRRFGARLHASIAAVLCSLPAKQLAVVTRPHPISTVWIQNTVSGRSPKEQQHPCLRRPNSRMTLQALGAFDVSKSGLTTESAANETRLNRQSSAYPKDLVPSCVAIGSLGRYA